MPKRKLKRAVKMRKRDTIDQTKYSTSHNTHIKPSSNWFGDTRLMPQKDLQLLQSKYKETLEDPYKFIVSSKQLPTSILKEPSFKNKINHNGSFSILPGKLRKHQLCQSLKANSLEEFMNPQKPTPKIAKDPSNTKISNKNIDFKSIDSINKFTRIGRSDRIRSEVLKLIDSSDIILMILDARDPEGTRVRPYENLIKTEHKKKKIIYILNKIDLTPKNITIEWMKRLSKIAPTIAFSSGSKRFHFTKDFGSAAIIKVLKQIKSIISEEGRDWMSVGVLGYPNVGKSSFINSMKKKNVCTSAPKAGETKETRYVLLEGGIYLIDCPGIVCPQPGETKSDLVLRGVCRSETIEEPERYLEIILNRIDKNIIKNFYDIKDDWKSVDEFIEKLGRRRGRILKGDKVDVDVVSKTVIADWNRGKLPWYKKPEEESENKKIN